MTLARIVFTVIVAISLAALPARIGVIGVAAASDVTVSSMSDCALTGEDTCDAELASAAPEAASDHTAMPGGCDKSGADHGTTLPGACSTYCHSLPALPTTGAATVEIVLIAALAPAIATMLDGIGISPEPHPPKRILI